MGAALIVFSVFAGVSLVVATVAACIFIADGKLTLPNTNARKLMHAKTAHELVKAEWEITVMRSNVDAAYDERLNRVLERGS